MKTKLFFGCFGILLLLFSCQKEELNLSTAEPFVTPSIRNTAALEFIKEMIPDNVSVASKNKKWGQLENIPWFYPDTLITLANCQEQQCHQIVPSIIRQVQQRANFSCKPRSVSICCCAKGSEWCYTFKVHPSRACPKSNLEWELLPSNKQQVDYH